jgi:hypothetical protein
MLLIEKYFKDSGLAFSEPLADKSGLLSYYCSDAADSNTYIFIYYCWESGKNHPGYYSFKKYTVSEKIDSNTNMFLKDSMYKSWTEFFGEIESIKKNINSCRNYVVPKTSVEAENLLWRAFLQSQDTSLATLFQNLPECFYNSIDDELTPEKQSKEREEFLNYLRYRYFIIYNSWNYFFEVDIHKKFCNWFYNYVTS